MKRRTYLQLGAAGVVGAAGCLGRGNPNTVLDAPDREVDSEDLAYPAWGERVPDVTVPAPIEDRSVSLRDVDRPSVLTFFYSHCMTVCPALISALRNVQTHSLNNGYADDVQFLPTTFDPERDDAARLETYAGEMHVGLDAGNWTFLRPESRERAHEVVNGEFGVGFQRTETDGDGYMFAHLGLVLLVNADGYVERAYASNSPSAEPLIEDLRAVREAR